MKVLNKSCEILIYITRLILLLFLIVQFSSDFIWADIDTQLYKNGDEFVEYHNLEKTRDKGKWLPVPIPISNPAVGQGLAVGLLYLHPAKYGNPDMKSATSGLGVMYTNSQSWLTGIFHDNTWIEDRLRFTALLGYGELNLQFYGTGPDSIFKNMPVEYNIVPGGFFWQLIGEPVKNTNWYFGLRHLYTKADIKFELNSYIDFLPDVNGELTTSSIGVVTDYDTRDNNFYPTDGNYFELAVSFDDPAWGSDFEYRKVSAFYNHYFPISNNVVLALRADLSMVDGDVPFYMLPSLSMRGFAAGRYSDEAALSGHVEWRHKFLPRWGYILSFEWGYVNDSLNGILKGRSAYSLGTGLRWQVLSSEKIHLGLDFGINEDDHSICVQVGERF